MLIAKARNVVGLVLSPPSRPTTANGWVMIEGGVGHNLPQEAPQAFAEAIIEVDTY